MTYYIVTFGCQQNEADSERIASMLESRGMEKAQSMYTADHVVINTCMVRQMAENRVYGTVHNLVTNKLKDGKPKKIVVTGCMVGMASRDKTGKFLKLIKSRMPYVDEFLPIEEVGFDHAHLRSDQLSAWVPIANGCNNFCTFCVVPFTRGREISRPYKDILSECRQLAQRGYKKITLLGMNVNSYGADLIVGQENVQVLRDIDKTYFENSKSEYRNSKQSKNPNDRSSKRSEHSNIDHTKLFRASGGTGRHLPSEFGIRNSKRKLVYVKHLGRFRIPTLFPYLLEDVCKVDGIESVSFMSSNPWDFSDKLIEVIAKNPKIDRQLHFALQSGSNAVLRRMNRWYTREQYLSLLTKIRNKVAGVEFSTDIIVGFCGETDEEYRETVDLVKKARFFKAYIAMYSDRPMTAAHKVLKDDVPHPTKKKRWKILEDIINKPNLHRMKQSS